MSTQLVLNKYNTNYEALRLADSTALAFNLGNFIKAIYYKWMNYHEPKLHKKLIKINHESSENQAKPPKINPTNQTEDLDRS